MARLASGSASMAIDAASLGGPQPREVRRERGLAHAALARDGELHAVTSDSRPRRGRSGTRCSAPTAMMCTPSQSSRVSRMKRAAISMPVCSGIRTRSRVRRMSSGGHRDAGDVLVHEARHAAPSAARRCRRAPSRPRSRACSMKREEALDVVDGLGLEVARAGRDLLVELGELRRERVGVGRDDGAREEVRRAVQLVAGQVGARR